MIAGLLAIILILDRASWLHTPKPDVLVPAAFCTLILMVPQYLIRARVIRVPSQLALAYNVGLGILVCICIWLAFTGGLEWARSKKFRWYQLTLGAAFLLLTAALYINVSQQPGELLYRDRNFYGTVSVLEVWDKNMLIPVYEFMHGGIAHGMQLKKNRKLPVSYYGQYSGAHAALVTNPRRARGPMRVGAVGLGIGTLAAYAQPGDVYRFYELNPSAIRLAQGEGGYFTYLSDAPAQIEIVPGDGRLSLEAEAARQEWQKFDVLFLDAFNGDSVPVHLLTREAMALYLSHMAGPDSLIAVNVTNFAINLIPVVAALAKEFDLKATLVESTVLKGAFLPSRFVLLRRNDFLDAPLAGHDGYSTRLDWPRKTKQQLWTDNYSNVLTLMLGR